MKARIYKSLWNADYWQAELKIGSTFHYYNGTFIECHQWCAGNGCKVENITIEREED